MVLEVGLCLALLAQQPIAGSELPKGITVVDSRIEIEPGAYRSAGAEIKVAVKAAFEITPAEVLTVKDEPVKLSKDKPESWGKGTRLRSVDTTGINAYHAYVAGSLSMRRAPDGPALQEGADYLVSPEFAMVGLGPKASVTSDDTVYASYRYGLQRIDSVFVDGGGAARLVRGKPDISVPLAPEAPPGCVRLLNLYRPYGATTLTPDNVFPVLEAPEAATTRTTRGRIPKLLEKIHSGKPVTVVCWGDSVTTGGDVSRGSRKYVEQFRTMLLDRFSYAAPINIINISVGGTNSAMWLRRDLYNDDYFVQNPMWPKDQIDFNRISSLKPDLVTIEFVNDGGLDTAGVESVYSDIMARLSAYGTEFILITPHFTSLDMMGNKSLRDPDNRKYVEALRVFADKHNVALADASSRWAHLWREGTPYVTLLANCLNHPDDRGHRLFAEELIKCFEMP